MKVFGKKQKRIQLVVRKAPKYSRLDGEAKKQIFVDLDSGVSRKKSSVILIKKRFA